MVSMQKNKTIRTEMNAVAQTFRHDSAAVETFLSRVSGGNWNYFAPSLGCFEAKDIEEPKPSHVSHRPVQPSIFSCPSLHILNIDYIILSYQIPSNFEMEVPPLIGDLFVRFCEKDSCFPPSVASLYPMRDSLLSHFNQFFRLVQQTRIGNRVAFGVGQEPFAPDINTDFLASFRKRFDRNIIARECDKELAASRPAYRDSFDVSFNRSGQKEFEPTYTLDIEVSAFQLPASLLQREGIIRVFASKAREARLAVILLAAPEKRLECLILPLENILKRLRADSLEFGIFLFEFHQLSHLLIGGDRLFLLTIGVDMLLKGEIIEHTAEFKPLFAVGFSLLICDCPVEKRFPYAHNYTIPQYFICKIPHFAVLSRNYFQLFCPKGRFFRVFY